MARSYRFNHVTHTGPDDPEAALMAAEPTLERDWEAELVARYLDRNQHLSLEQARRHVRAIAISIYP